MRRDQDYVQLASKLLEVRQTNLRQLLGAASLYVRHGDTQKAGELYEMIARLEHVGPSPAFRNVDNAFSVEVSSHARSHLCTLETT